MVDLKFNKTLGAVLLCLLGYMMVSNLIDNCHRLSSSDCGFLWILSVGSILGGIGLTEILLTGQETQQQNSMKDETKVENKQKAVPVPSIWQRAIIRITLSSILLSLPIIFQGAVISTFLGLFVGAIIDILVRGFSNKLPS